uniref:G protein-coupled receptor n=1 Tax=Steinernema glaseri TaxID=37863 RepID=A0A1I7ZD66_9BILA
MKKRTLWACWAYKLIVSIAVTDLIQLVPIGFSAFLTLTQISVGMLIMKAVFLFIINEMWIESALSLSLAIYRFLDMFGFLRQAVRNRICKILHNISWFCGIPSSICFLWTGVPVEHTPMGLYNNNFPNQTVYFVVWTSAIGTQMVVAFVLYGLIIASVIAKRHKATATEYRALLQAFLPFLWTATKPSAFLTYGPMTDLFGEVPANAIFHFFMRSSPLVHVAVYLILNKTIAAEMVTFTWFATLRRRRNNNRLFFITHC